MPLPEGRTLFAHVWRAQVGRVPLLLLDSDVPGNDEAMRNLTDRLYGGAGEQRLQQEMLLGIGGVEAIKRIRALPPPRGRIAIVGISGRAEDEAAARAAGADAFLVKPVSPRALATALHEAIRRAAAAT